MWNGQIRGKGLPINRPALQQMAMQFKRQIKEEDEEFNASVSWLDMTLNTNALSTDKEAIPHKLKEKTLESGKKV